ncbi:hypothetical protein FHL15_010537 [Xylaria flabelliformis]|uniref:Mitochondrial thiamine pyrophosphate carrier 1 n=1 Tax=Xylaria flabelliformis TaxID=2512241 RepID=A0A553HKV3_9PEZI|nr:hypothetical protein FHL15_010537 [Xylaria flabelliformis]
MFNWSTPLAQVLTLSSKSAKAITSEFGSELRWEDIPITTMAKSDVGDLLFDLPPPSLRAWVVVQIPHLRESGPQDIFPPARNPSSSPLLAYFPLAASGPDEHADSVREQSTQVLISAATAPFPLTNATLALQPKTFGEGSTAVAKMAQPTAEPVEEYDYEALPPNFSLVQNMAAGAFAGIAEHTVMYPIDAIKTRMQIINPSAGTVYKGMIQSTMRIASGEGFMNLWRGMSSVVVGAGPAHAVYFATYEAVKHLMGGNRTGTHHPLAAATSGACATIASDALMNPFDVIKQRMQIQNSSKMYRSMTDCAKYVYRTEGLSAFYISYPTTLSMTVPFTALQFLAYESISTTMNPDKAYDPFTHCTAGAVAGGFAAALTTPMDVIKTMLQTRGTASDAELRSVNGFVAGCKLLYQREGLRGFFKGVRPRIVTTMPSTAICWSAYEASK